jgi:hypothetical protein
MTEHFIENPNTIEQSIISKSIKLLENNPITLYHGNKDKDMIPKFGLGKSNNDYGQGFYTTPDKELGKEWAYSFFSHGNNNVEQGYLHSYEFDINGLNVLNLAKIDSMHWLAELLYNRKLDLDMDMDSDLILSYRVEKFISKYKLDTDKYDIIIGYRADDKYFSYAEGFMRMELYRESLEKALRLGNLGLQVFIKSPYAFDRLAQSKHNCEVVDTKYRNYYIKRDKEAREQFTAIQREDRKRINIKTGHTVLDVL